MTNTNDKRSSGLPCPCGVSSDAFAVYEDGWGHCFRGDCGKHFSPEEFNLDNNTPAKAAPKKGNLSSSTSFRPLPTTVPKRGLPERGLTAETLKRYKVSKDGDKIVYPLFDTSNNHIANKIRTPNKDFPQEGQTKNPRKGLWGRQAFPPKGKAITVTEGNDDAMAVFQMFGYKYPSVSVHSSGSAVKDIKRDFEYLNSFDQIIFCFDNDDAGQEALKKVADLPFPLGKVRVLTLRKFKDANDYLREGLTKQFIEEWWKAPAHSPDGLKFGSEMWGEIIDRKEAFTVEYPWEGLNEKLFGLRLSEMVVVAADPKVGKTTFLKELEHHLLTHPDVTEKGYGVGFMHFEEPNGDTALGLISIHNSKPYHLPTSERPEGELKQAFDELLNNNRVVIWDHFGSNEVEKVLDKVRHMHAMGCRYIVIDHLSIIVSNQAGDERKQLDEIATKLKTLTMELDIAVIAVIHTNRQGQIRGTAGVEQLANVVLRLERNKMDENEWRRNISKVSVSENRFCGFTGPASYLHFNSDTSRQTELPHEDIQVFEAGGSKADEVF